MPGHPSMGRSFYRVLQAAPVPVAMWKKRNAVARVQREYKTADEVLSEAGEAAPAAARQQTTTVLDMRGPQARVVTNLEHLNVQDVRILAAGSSWSQWWSQPVGHEQLLSCCTVMEPSGSTLANPQASVIGEGSRKCSCCQSVRRTINCCPRHLLKFTLEPADGSVGLQHKYTGLTDSDTTA